MRGQTLRTVALLTFMLSLGLGVVAYRMSVPEPAAAPVEIPQTRTVVAIEPLEADEPIPAGDVALRAVELRPDSGFGRPEDVVGRRPSRRVEVGEPLLASHFREGGVLSLGLREGERAVAVRVDGVVGLGGFARPGDLVDVLFFAKRDGREVEATQARILLESARVLTFGKVADAAGPDRPALDARTAVLAVPRDEAPMLLLADSAGKLRLALRDVQTLGPSARPARSASIELNELVEERRRQQGGGGPSTVVYRGLER